MLKILNPILKKIYPEPDYCCHCESELTGWENQYGICNKCLNSIQFFSDFDLKDIQKAEKQYFDQVRGVAFYEGNIKDLIYSFKYYSKRELIFPLVELMVAHYPIVFPKEKWDGFIPVAMHEERLRERGYNHALLLARGLSFYLNLPCCDWVTRIKETLPQNKLNREERQKNMEGAFQLKKEVKVKDKNWLIIDDIFTTGTTCDEIARVLKEAGGRHIGVYVLASGRIS
ncbi:MAG: ComF family protein [Halanaerobiales bacterium]|nr:ComF family protein [Halanaerobiales bacterium]